MTEIRKIPYKEVPSAVWYVIKLIWAISPKYVILAIIYNTKDRIVPYSYIFISSAVASKLPSLLDSTENVRPILYLSALAAIIALVNQVINLFLTNALLKCENLTAIKMKQAFHEKFAKIPYSLYEDKNVIDSFDYANDFMHRFSKFGIYQITSAMGNILDLLFATIALIAVAWYLPILAIISFPYLIKSILEINRVQAEAGKTNQTERRQIWAIERMFTPRKIKETRLYETIDHLLVKRTKIFTSIFLREYQVEKLRSHNRLKRQLTSEGLKFIAIATAIWKIAYHGSPIGIYVLAQQLSDRTNNAIISLFDNVISFDEDLYGFAEYKYITEELQPKDDISKKLVPTGPNIKIENMNFAYPQSNNNVLKNINIDIPYGSSIAIVGENGAGKTTLVKLILGLYKPKTGSISINNTPLQEYEESSWLKKIGVLIQDFEIGEHITIREAVWMGKVSEPKDDKKIWAALTAAEMTEKIKELPHQLDSYLGKWIDKEKGSDFSGGEDQRIAIARALFRDPEILILDEPTSAIDANAEVRIFDRLIKSRKNKTTIFISHRFSTVRHAEKIIFVEKGKIAEAGTHEELMKLNGKYAEMFTKQSQGYK